MTAVINPTVIKRTQEELGKYVKKPPLTDKLLGKPPFRFLHDVINAVITNTGFLDGLFSVEELSSDNIKDKDTKIAFLQKCIDATSLATGQAFAVRPSKIVAGHDVDKTNEWLQALGKAITQKVDSTDAVQKILSGAKPENIKNSEKGKSDKKPERAKKESSRGKDEKAKEKSSRKEKGRDEREGKKSSRSKKDPSKEEKNEKGRRKPKDAPEKRSKSRAGNHASQSVEPGKENAPSDEKTDVEETVVNDEAPEENIENDPEIGSARQGSAKPGNPASGDNALELGGPESMLNTEEQPNKDENQEEPLPENNNNIDPAILKAMAPGHDVIDPNEANELLEPPSAPEPPDSGVGSLESPKHAQQQQERSSPPTRAASSKLGPQPLRALEQFGEEASAPPLPMAQTPMPDEAEQARFGGREKSSRPRTGRRSARPPSARPAPPKVRERKEIPKEEQPRPPTGKPVANVILSSDLADNDDDDTFMVEESKPAIADELITADSAGERTAVAAAAAAVGEDGEGAGLLVAQILETKKELEDGRRNAFSPETPGHRRVQIEQSQLSDANRRKERELIQKDVQKLSGSIQSLTRSVNPLAKMLDYLQEDLDSMHKELETWRDENKQLGQTLKREQSMTEQALEPLRAQLGELESAVQEQRDRLSAVKSNILRNNEKISRLIAGINLNM
ncbi:intraciliary transport [Halocaridina rubra]|uniref:TRAF3-interacting protein 1 n=1 Tax=Halocaridina rubra TaxID=373956 RepID=A0AAN8WVU0_HALRR